MMTKQKKITFIKKEKVMMSLYWVSQVTKEFSRLLFFWGFFKKISSLQYVNRNFLHFDDFFSTENIVLILRTKLTLFIENYTLLGPKLKKVGATIIKFSWWPFLSPKKFFLEEGDKEASSQRWEKKMWPSATQQHDAFLLLIKPLKPRRVVLRNGFIKKDLDKQHGNDGHVRLNNGHVYSTNARFRWGPINSSGCGR